MSYDFNEVYAVIQKLRSEVKKVLIGQDEVLDQVLCALCASGHVLVEGLPGLGKTLMVRALAQAFGGSTNRVQFTPDLMPSDLIGHTMYDTKNGTFSTRKGPVFTHLFIADEINRAPAKTQAALLEVMQEYQVTLDGKANVLQRPFLVLATQNPFEHEGTYPLPDAQLDRFLMKLQISYPDKKDEIVMVNQALQGNRGDILDLSAVNQVTDIACLLKIQDACTKIIVAPQIIEYAVNIINETRSSTLVKSGAGPRASLALVRLSRANALLNERDFVTPDDIKKMAGPVLCHRIILDPEWELSGGTALNAVHEIIMKVETPRT